MILSNVAIQRAIADHRLVIDPAPAPLRPIEGRDCPYQTSAVDLLLGEEVSWLREGHAIAMDLRQGGFVRTFQANSESRRIAEDQPYALKPGKFVLAQTYERIELPLLGDRSLAARVEGRSSYARCGLLVHFTAPTIHAGFAGRITLEMMNFGPYIISLYPRMPICQLIVEEVAGEPFCNASQFHGQVRPGGGA